MLNCQSQTIKRHSTLQVSLWNWFGKSVIWIEANPVIFKELRKNLREFRFQNCYQGLLHSKNNLILDFFLSTNDQASSSIYDFSKKFKEKKIFFQDKKRKIEMYDKIKLKTITLDNLISLQKLNLENFNHWVVDVQGAELEVLRGGVNLLCSVDYVCVETGFNQPRRNVPRDAAFQILNLLDSSGFDLVSVNDGSTTLPSDDGSMKQFDLLFSRRSSY